MKRTLFTVLGTSLLLSACGEGSLFAEPEQVTTGSITPANALSTRVSRTANSSVPNVPRITIPPPSSDLMVAHYLTV